MTRSSPNNTFGEKYLIVEYGGEKFHTKNPGVVTKHNFDYKYLEYYAQGQLKLEGYGFRLLRINKLTLLPQEDYKARMDVLNHLLERSFAC